MSQRMPPDAADSPWQTTAAREVYRNRWLHVTEYAVIRPDGNTGIYGVINPRDGVAIVALDDVDQVLLIQDFIYPLQQWTWSVPCGGIEAGEEPRQAAARELAEEGGVAADEWLALPPFWPVPGISPHMMHPFLARGLRPTIAQSDPTEVITRQWVPLAEAVARCRRGEIRHASAMVALLQAEALRRG